MDSITTRFAISIPHGRLHEFIETADNALLAIRETPFHSVVGKDFLHHTDDAATYLERFIRSAAARGPLAAVYCEMNGFAINTDKWYFSAFGYKTAGNIKGYDWNWLAYSDADSDPDFILTGMERVQDAFQSAMDVISLPLHIEIAQELAICQVTARFIELIAAAHLILHERAPDIAAIPILSTAHDWDVIHCST